MSVRQDDDTAGQGGLPPVKPAVTEFAAGAVFVVIALIASWSLLTDPYLAMERVDDDPGPAFIPWLGTTVIGLGGLAQMVWAVLRARKAGGMRETGEFVLSRLWIPLLLVLLLIGYQVVMRPIGFVAASILFAVPTIAVIHWRARGVFNARYLVQLPVEAVLIVAGIYLVFSYGINVPFP